MGKLTLIAALLGVVLAFGAGCSDAEQPAPKKEDFQKTAPPANWRGPGQPGAPGGPAAGPPKGSGPIDVPDNIKNGTR